MGRKQPSETKNRTTPRSSGRRNKSETGSVVPDSIKAKHVKDKDKCNEAKDTDFVAKKSIRRKTTSKNSCPNTKYEQDYGDETSELLQTETSNAKGKSTRSKRKKEWEHYKNSRSKDTNDNKPVKFKPSAAVNQTCLDNESELQEQSGSTKGRKGKKYDKEIIKEEVEVVHDRLNDLHGSCFPENIQNNSRVEGKDIKTIRLKHNCKDTEKVRRKSLEKDIVLQVKQEKIENKKDTRIVSAEKKLNTNNSSDVLSILMQMEGPSVSKGYSHSVAMVQDDKMMLDSVTVETVGADTVKESENSGRKGKKRPNMSKSTEKKGKSKGDIVSEYFVKEEFDSDANTDDFLSDQTKRRKTFPTDVEGAASKQELGKKKLDQSKRQTVTKATGSRKKTDSFLTKVKRKATKRKIEHDSVESESKSKQIGKGSKKLDSNDESSTASESATQSRKRKKDDTANKDKGGDSTNLSDSSTLECKLGDVTKRENKTGKSTKSGRKTVTDLPQKSTGTKKGKKVTEETKEVPRDHIPSHINKSDVMSILMHMEGPSTSKVDTDSNFMEDDEMSDTDSEEKVDKRAEQTSDDSEDDWEDVEDHHGDSPKKSQTPSKSVEITLEAPVIYKKRKKKEFDLHDYLKKRVNKYKRELALDMHKVHLLLLISRGMYLNTVCKADTLRAQVMSVVMAARELRCSTVKFRSQDHVANVLKWMNKEFQLVESKSSIKMTMEERLTCCLENRTLNGSLEFTLVCIMVLRYLGFMVRLVMSLQPIPYKQAQKTGAQKSVKAQRSSKSKGKHTTTDKKETKTLKSNKFKDEKSELQKTSDSKHKKKKASAMLEANESEHSSGKRNKRRCSKNLSKGAYREVDNVEEDNDDDLDEDFKDVDEMDSGSESEEDVKVKNRKKPAAKKSVLSSQIIADKDDQNLSSDSDFEESSILIRTQPLKRESSKKKNNRVLSSDSEGSPKQDCKQNVSGNDTWLEVYIKTENKWISICSKCKEVSKPAAIRSQATAPLYYVVGIDNDNALKDVTIRYASEWLTKTRKLRVEDDWWTETLEPFCTEDKDRDKAEDKEMHAYLLQCPLPTSVSQFKGHPLYILKRHLLKYEALYPNSIVPLGFIRGEPVYSRDCCHTLHSRENWLKEGRCVRLGEEPYKYVKSRKRWNDKDSEPKECELFGKWQTEIYIPPPAVDGVIPRNAHGNVEMFQTWMLPGGTVHLKGLPALNRIARKLDIDCAPAMVGWDHHCGFAHPVMDGWIVCEEHKDILLAAWDEEQEIIQQREIEKREKRVYENWKKLIRGLLIKDRLKKRYDLEEKKGQPASEQRSEGDKEPRESTSDVPQSWPRNRLTEFKSAFGVLQK